MSSEFDIEWQKIDVGTDDGFEDVLQHRAGAHLAGNLRSNRQMESDHYLPSRFGDYNGVPGDTHARPTGLLLVESFL